MLTVVIPLKLPSLNQYIGACRSNAFAGAQMKKKQEKAISQYLEPLPLFERPVRIHFIWQEENRRRDLDNVCFAKKFILDAMVKSGKLKDDNRRFVAGFTDSFTYGDKAQVTLEITEIEEE